MARQDSKAPASNASDSGEVCSAKEHRDVVRGSSGDGNGSARREETHRLCSDNTPESSRQDPSGSASMSFLTL